MCVRRVFINLRSEDSDKTWVPWGGRRLDQAVQFFSRERETEIWPENSILMTYRLLTDPIGCCSVVNFRVQVQPIKRNHRSAASSPGAVASGKTGSAGLPQLHAHRAQTRSEAWGRGRPICKSSVSQTPQSRARLHVARHVIILDSRAFVFLRKSELLGRDWPSDLPRISHVA